MDQTAPTVDTDPAATPAPSATAKREPVSLRVMIAFLLLAGGIVTVVALILSEPPAWPLRLASAACLLLAAWLLVWKRLWYLQLGIGVAFIAISAATFAIDLLFIGWPTAGGGLGACAAWAYGQPGRARTATLALLTGGYAVGAGTGLLQTLRGDSTWWLLAQGLSSLLVGWLGLLVAQRLAATATRATTAAAPTEEADQAPQEPDTEESSGSPAATQWRSFGRLLILWGILLPYLGLTLYGLGQMLK